MSFCTDRVRVAMFVKRKATISKEQFHQYWAETHAPLVSSLNIVKANLLKYEQAHTNETMITHLTPMALPFPLSEWDGIAIFEAESYAKFFEVCQSEEYQRKLVPDEDAFLDRKGCQLLLLNVLTVIDK
ncbi:EthD domain-containing protein [Mycena albidolilacea]|uniref:EthD domain-containing protein n=1 Tax=Mycena albidolilacea TaxID=1033008 RepID=A0AAD7AP19_9AGAR|nr:EthD domain-containing protein [Mycena albidolilacea]